MVRDEDTRYSDYDQFAWFYNRYWGPTFIQKVLPVVEKLLLAQLSPGSRILDLCCGPGQLARALLERGFHVTGIDGSAEMLRYARLNAPGADFVLADARALSLRSEFEAAVSTFDSLNHLMSLTDLGTVFHHVFQGLLPGGRFLFDLNMEEGYRLHWQNFVELEDDNVCIVRPKYYAKERVDRNEITMFRKVDGQWQRVDLALWQRCYSEREVRAALAEAGFEAVVAYDAKKDLGMMGGAGRVFFHARKESGS